MKKILSILLMIICFFSISGCQNEARVNIDDAVYGIDITFRLVDTGSEWTKKTYWDIKYFVDHEKIDLSSANRVEIKTYIPKYDNYSNLGTYAKTFYASIPEDVTPEKDKNYFLLSLDSTKYDPTRKYSYAVGEEPNFVTDENGIRHFYPSPNLILLECFALVFEAPGTEVGPNTLPSIFNTILIGIGMVVIGVILYWIAVVLIQRKIALLIAFMIPVIITIGSFITWNFSRGIIMTIFFAIYYIAISILAKRIDDYLDELM